MRLVRCGYVQARSSSQRKRSAQSTARTATSQQVNRLHSASLALKVAGCGRAPGRRAVGPEARDGASEPGRRRPQGGGLKPVEKVVTAGLDLRFSR